MNYLRYIIALVSIASLPLLSSCREKPLVEEDEDYKKLFPFMGISKPDTSFEDMTVMPCDPEMALNAYKYPGVDITEDARDYVVTIKALFTLPDGTTEARYLLRYIGADKQLITASSITKDGAASESLVANKEFVKTFTVRSGYPLYLSVNGVAPRGSTIKASISARSVDGLIVVPELSMEQSQNKEGPNPIPAPYCEYIILP